MRNPIPSNPKEVAQSVRETGFALLVGYLPEMSSAEAVCLLGDAESLGEQGPVHQLRPALAEDCPLNTYSGNYGLSSFPLHTDMAHWYIPPRYLMLRCIQGSIAVSTVLTDALPIIEQVGKTALTRALVKPRRMVQGKHSLLRLYERSQNGDRFLRWDEKYIVPASRAGEHGISELRGALAVAPRRNIHLARSGDTLILDNWRMLHGRGSVPTDALNRTIARAYLRNIHSS